MAPIPRDDQVENDKNAENEQPNSLLTVLRHWVAMEDPAECYHALLVHPPLISQEAEGTFQLWIDQEESQITLRLRERRYLLRRIRAEACTPEAMLRACVDVFGGALLARSPEAAALFALLAQPEWQDQTPDWRDIRRQIESLPDSAPEVRGEASYRLWQAERRGRQLTNAPVHEDHDQGHAEGDAEGEAHLREALRAFPLKSYPYRHALILAALAEMLGARASNPLTPASVPAYADPSPDPFAHMITAYTETLTIFTQEDFPVHRAAVCFSLGQLYLEQAEEAPAPSPGLFETALRYVTAATRAAPPAVAPELAAQAQSMLGRLYLRRHQGVRADNLERAIVALQTACSTFPAATLSDDVVLAQLALGDAYRDRQAGTRQENRDAALAHYQEALQGTLREVSAQAPDAPEAPRLDQRLGAFPAENAYLHVQLGQLKQEEALETTADPLVYHERLEQAITHFQVALQGYRHEGDLEGRVICLCHLGRAWNQRLIGDRIANGEKAVAYYRLALWTEGRQIDPALRAQIMTGLASTYQRRLRGTREANRGQAVALLRQALTLLDPDEQSEDSATACLNLGAIYSEDFADHPEHTIELAITYSQQALRCFTPENTPYDWALAHLNLGNACQRRVLGSRRQNLEEALTHYESARPVLERFGTPPQRIALLNGLGYCLLERMTHQQEETIEQAIVYLAAAEALCRQYNLQEECAGVCSNLSTAYQRRLIGRPAENIERALELCLQALHLRPFRRAPQDQSLTLNTLGTIYLRRERGDRARNIERAIACYHVARRVLSRRAAPRLYSVLCHNLGYAYSERMAGDRLRNLKHAEIAYRKALRERPPESLPFEHRDTQLNLAWLYYGDTHPDEPFPGGLTLDDRYRAAHVALVAARRAQAAVGGFEADAWGRALQQGVRPNVRDQYARDAWLCWRLGDLPSAVVALEAGRAQAMAEAQAITGAFLAGVCPPHREAFEAARQRWVEARRDDDRVATQQTHRHILQVRDAIRQECKPDFLPEELDYIAIAQAADDDQALIYLSAGDQGGLALVLPPAAKTSQRTPNAISLPALTWQQVREWVERLDEEGRPVGGYRFALLGTGLDLLLRWAVQDGAAQERLVCLTTPLRAVAEKLPATLSTIREGLAILVTAWERELALLKTSAQPDQQRAQRLRALLDTPLGEVLTRPEDRAQLGQDLRRAFLFAELSPLLEDVGAKCIMPLRQGLDVMGLTDRDLAIALIPCGRLGLLPLHAATVAPHALGGDHPTSPFQETCLLSLQASARSLAAARMSVASLRVAGPVLAVGGPTFSLRGAAALGDLVPPPPTVEELPWARVEALCCAMLGEQAGRLGSRAYVREVATRAVMVETMRQAPEGAIWVLATHGRSDPADPQQRYLLLAWRERLDLALLHRERLLRSARLFCASGCVTALGDMDVAPDELGSLAAGLLQSGAAGVVATQWPVSDKASFLLNLLFLRGWLQHPDQSPAWALREASHHLRFATRDELHSLAQLGLAGLSQLGVAWDQLAVGVSRPDPTRGAGEGAGAGEQDDAERLVDPRDTDRLTVSEALRETASGTVWFSPDDPFPYAHPFCWAAAVFYGA